MLNELSISNLILIIDKEFIEYAWYLLRKKERKKNKFMNCTNLWKKKWGHCFLHTHNCTMSLYIYTQTSFTHHCNHKLIKLWKWSCDVICNHKLIKLCEWSCDVIGNHKLIKLWKWSCDVFGNSISLLDFEEIVGPHDFIHFFKLYSLMHFQSWLHKFSRLRAKHSYQ